MFMPIADLFADKSIYVIPTFQRPYAWDDPQWKDLKDDVNIAAAKKQPYHYFSPIHVIRVVDPGAELWKCYVDTENTDLNELTGSEFRDLHSTLHVFLVVDGQQRLITLYSLLYACSPQAPHHFIDLASNFRIPKVILNPADDHSHFRGLIGLGAPGGTAAPAINSRSQDRLSRPLAFVNPSPGGLFQAGSPEHLFLTGRDCQTLRVELPSGSKLASFMTLNDRGKDLTTLEKSKSLLMELDDNQPGPAGPQPHAINRAFGNLYRSLERQEAYFDDDEFLRQAGMAMWEGTVQNVHRETAPYIYENRLRHLSKPAGAIIHSLVLPTLEAGTRGHDRFVDLIDQAKRTAHLGVPSFVCALGAGGVRDAIEDYYAILLSLELGSKRIGFQLAVHEKFKIQLHDTLGTFTVDNSDIKGKLFAELGVLIATANNHPLKELANQVHSGDSRPG